MDQGSDDVTAEVKVIKYMVCVYYNFRYLYFK